MEVLYELKRLYSLERGCWCDLARLSPMYILLIVIIKEALTRIECDIKTITGSVLLNRIAIEKTGRNQSIQMPAKLLCYICSIPLYLETTKPLIADCCVIFPTRQRCTTMLTLVHSLRE